MKSVELLGLGTPLARRAGVVLPSTLLDRARAHGSLVVHVDSSALVKLVVAEPDAAALRRYLRLPVAIPRRSR
jgi:hypothetical protein